MSLFLYAKSHKNLINIFLEEDKEFVLGSNLVNIQVLSVIMFNSLKKNKMYIWALAKPILSHFGDNKNVYQEPLYNTFDYSWSSSSIRNITKVQQSFSKKKESVWRPILSIKS